MNEMKTCSRCGETKPAREFHRQGTGYKPACKECRNASSRMAYAADDSKKLKNRQYYLNNKEKEKARKAAAYRANPSKTKERHKVWSRNNPDKLKMQRARAHKKRVSTPGGRLSLQIKNGMTRGLKFGGKQGRRTFDILGYSFEELMSHLERQFQPGMTWENYGEWHVDHKTPLSAHNYETIDDIDFKRAWALSNLQPLWGLDNKRKHAKLSQPFQPSLPLAVNDNKPQELAS